ncbi:MAG: hypothetical protein ABJR05_00085 [Balneola sp.]
MKHQKITISSVTFLSMLILAGIFVYNCDNTLSPVLEGESIYTVYGILDLDKQRNFIRVNDIKTQSNSEEELELDVNVSLTNLNTSFTEILRDSLIIYDGDIATHNFYTENPIQFNTEYKVSVKDKSGDEVTIETKTPVEIQPKVIGENSLCKEVIVVELDGIDIRAGELLKVEKGFEFRDRMVWLVWNIFADNNTEFNKDENIIKLKFTANSFVGVLSEDIDAQKTCTLLSSDILKINFTHFGGFEKGQVITNKSGDFIPGSRIVIGKYARELEIKINTDDFMNSQSC